MPKISLTKTILLTAGAAFGALLFAPKSGKEFREDLKGEAKKLGESTKEHAKTLKEDFKDSYEEAEMELEREQLAMDQKQAQLSQTIQDIEREIETEEQSQALSVPDSVADIDLGNVRGTSLEPEHDEVVPSSELDEALHDNDLSKDNEFDIDSKQTETDVQRTRVAANQNSQTAESGNITGTKAEPTEDEVVPADELDEALHDNYLSDNDDFQVDDKAK